MWFLQEVPLPVASGWGYERTSLSDREGCWKILLLNLKWEMGEHLVCWDSFINPALWQTPHYRIERDPLKRGDLFCGMELPSIIKALISFFPSTKQFCTNPKKQSKINLPHQVISINALPFFSLFHRLALSCTEFRWKDIACCYMRYSCVINTSLAEHKGQASMYS